MFNSISRGYRYVFHNLILKENQEWDINGDNGKGDALFRTSIAYIAYNNKILRQGILSCFRWFNMIGRGNKRWYQASRYFNRYREDDVSRDQIILALSALKINNDTNLKEIGLHLPYKISRRFSMSITLWIWIRAIIYENKFYTYLFQILELIEFLPSVLWNKLLRKIMGWNKEYSQDYYLDHNIDLPYWEYNTLDNKWYYHNRGGGWINNGNKLYTFHKHKKDTNKLYNFITKLEYPEFALHLTSWMIYTSKDTIIKKLLQKLAIWLAEKDNLLIRVLMNDRTISKYDINNFVPSKTYRWSTRFNGTSYSNILKEQDKINNAIDKDVLITIFNKNYNI